MKKGKRKPNLALIDLRKKLGKTQVQIAAMLGVSLSSIKNVETGQHPLSERLAQKIRIATGATMLDGKAARVLSLRPLGGGSRVAKEYTKEDFERHQKIFKSDRAAAKLAWGNVRGWLELLFMKAGQPDSRNRYRVPALTASLWDWMDKARTDFKIKISWPGPRRSSVGGLALKSRQASR